MSDQLDHLGDAEHKDELLWQMALEKRKEKTSWASACLNPDGGIETAYGHSRANVLADSSFADDEYTPCITWHQQKGEWTLRDRYNCTDDNFVEKARDALMSTP